MMAYQAKVFRVLIASPSDVAEERQTIKSLIVDWNGTHSDETGCVLLPVMWETHSTPEFGDEPQVILNRQIVDDCDALIGVFWTRIGTPTSLAASGTLEEIERIHEAGKPVMLYFSNRTPDHGKTDVEQLQMVASFRKACMRRGIISSYTDPSELENLLARHLVNFARKLGGGKTDERSEESRQQESTELAEVSDSLRSTIIWSEVDWNTEKESDPTNTDDGKQILQLLEESLHKFRVYLGEKIPERLGRYFDNVIRDAKKIRRHQTTMDGGKSFATFWKMGDHIIENAKKLGIEVALVVAADEDPSYSGPYKGYSAEELTEVLVDFLKQRDSEAFEANLGCLDAPSGSFMAGDLIHFRQLDDQLHLPPGTSRTLLREAAFQFDLKIKKATSNTIQFE